MWLRILIQKEWLLYGKLIVILFKRTISRWIRGFNKVLNSSNILKIEQEVLDVGWVAFMLPYEDKPWLYLIRDNVWIRIELKALAFLMCLWKL